MKKIKKIYDTVVIGAGPSGSLTAGLLARSGKNVMLVDQAEFPREKVCGDGLTGDSIRILQECGIWSELGEYLHKSEKVRLYPFKNNYFELNSPVYTFRRSSFDNFMLDWATHNGANFKNLMFTGDYKHNKDYTSIKMWNVKKQKTKKVRGRTIVFATGCQPNAYSLKTVCTNLEFKKDTVAIRGYCHAKWDIKNPLVYFKEELGNGYIWIFPMGDGAFNVGCGGRVGHKGLKALLKDFLATNEFTKDVEYSWEEQPKGAFINDSLVNVKYACIDNRILLVGEALGSTYPFTGEGIGKALETGKLAYETLNKALNNDDLSTLAFYPDFLKQKIGGAYKPYIVAERLFSKKGLGSIIFYLMCKSKFLSNTVSDILSERKSSSSRTLRFISKFVPGSVK